LGANTSCTFSVNVTATTPGTKTNTTGPIASAEGGVGGTASATVTVGAAPVTNVPTLQQWALMLLALLVIASAGALMRRR
jgi:hypothetical protein